MSAPASTRDGGSTSPDLVAFSERVRRSKWLAAPPVPSRRGGAERKLRASQAMTIKKLAPPVTISPERLGFLSITDAAVLVDRSPSTVRRWIKAGELVAVRVPRRTLVHRADVRRAAGRRARDLHPPGGWGTFSDGTPAPNWAEVIRAERESH